MFLEMRGKAVLSLVYTKARDEVSLRICERFTQRYQHAGSDSMMVYNKNLSSLLELFIKNTRGYKGLIWMF